jgi:hypothetical protein
MLAGQTFPFVLPESDAPPAHDLTLLTSQRRIQGIAALRDDNITAHSFPPQGPTFAMKVGPLC